MSPRTERLLLATILSGALVLRLLAWTTFPNILWPDELFQSVEQAHRLVFGFGITPWEFRDGTRSWLLPGALAAVMKVAGAFGGGAAGYLAAIALALSLLSLVPVAVAFAWARRDSGFGPAAVAAAACAVWFELVYFAPKALTEVVAAHVLVAGLFLLSGPRREGSGLAGAGALLGLAVALRIHLAPAVAAAVVVAWRGQVRGRAAGLLAGLGSGLLAVGLLDAATWTWPFESIVRSVWVNVVGGRSTRYGTLPASAYLAMVANVWSLGLVPILLLTAWGARRRLAAFACAGTIVATHSLLAHKEYRFVYPAVLLLVLLAALGAADLLAARAARGAGRTTAVALAAALAWAAGSAWLGARLDTADILLAERPGTPLWLRFRSTVEAFETLREAPRLCGIALAGVPWYVTPGYAVLHRRVPIYEVRSAAGWEQVAPHADAVLARPGFWAEPREAERCWSDGLCLYRAASSCTPEPRYDLNDRLRARGE